MRSFGKPLSGFHRFVIIWITQSISTFGSTLTQLALVMWLTDQVYALESQKAGLGAALAGLAVAGTLPPLLALPLAGVWADRHDRRGTMIAIDWANCGLCLVLLVMLINQQFNILWLTILMAVIFFLRAFHSLAFRASYALLVPPEKLPRANGMMETMEAVSGILAPTAAVILLGLPMWARAHWGWSLLRTLDNGMWIVLGVNALTFFLASMVLVFVRIPAVPALRNSPDPRWLNPRQVVADLGQGLQFIYRRPLIWLLVIFSVSNLTPTFEVMQPLLLRFQLAEDFQAHGIDVKQGLALFMTLNSIGGVVGGVLISALGGRRFRRIYGVLGALLIYAAGTFLMGISTWTYHSAAMIFILGAAIPFMNACSESIWQSCTPKELQGRVFAVEQLTTELTLPLGVVLTAWANSFMAPGTIMTIWGVFMALFYGALWFFNPGLRTMEERSALESAEVIPPAIGDSIGL